MSRENKFRAWDEINNKWIDGCDLIMESSGRVWAGDVNNPPMIQIKSENVVFFTGLKDKNGKEIFEGDILKCKCWDRKKSIKDGFDPLGETPYFFRNSVIEWWKSHCNLGYRLRDGKGKTLMIKPSSLRAMEVEIIGNIYECNQLLEATA